MALSIASSQDHLRHILKSIALISLSLVLVPIDTAFLCFTYARRFLVSDPAPASSSFHVPSPSSSQSGIPHARTSERITNHDPGTIASMATGSTDRRRTVLVTGVSMTKGLVLARLFHKAGHRVIGADFSPYACGRHSKAVDAYHVLRQPVSDGGAEGYVGSLIAVIEREDVHLWVSCSGVASAVEDGIAKEAVERRTSCRAVQFGAEHTRILHEKSSFMEHTERIGLPSPESHLVCSKEEMIDALDKAVGLSSSVGTASGEKGSERQFIAKCVGMNDKGRGDMTLLPLKTEKQTLEHVDKLASLGISDENPWVLQEYIDGEEFCTHALVIRGQVKAFVACPSAELLMHYVALEPSHPLSTAMLDFTRKQAASFGDGFTGHLSFDFMVRRSELQNPTDQIRLFPIECNPRAHTAVVLFARTPAMIDAYMAIFDKAGSSAHGSVLGDDNRQDVQLVTPIKPGKYYWIGNDLVTLLLHPTARLVLLQLTLADWLRLVGSFVNHVLFWKDGTLELDDSLPWYWLYHVYWPMQFWRSLAAGKRWSRINVSTTKMFEC